MIDYLRNLYNLFISLFNKLKSWFSNWGATNSSLEPALINGFNNELVNVNNVLKSNNSEVQPIREINLSFDNLSNIARPIHTSQDKEEGFCPRSTEKLLNNEERQKSISEGFQALDEGCKSIANLRAEIEMSQTESKTFKDNEPKVNNDLDAPVPANKKIPLRDGDKVSFRIGASTRDEFINPNHNALNAERQKKDPIEVNNKNISEVYEMSCFGSKPEKKRAQLKVVNAGSMEIKNKIIPSNISNISMRSNSDNNSINEYKPFLEKPARSNNAKFNEIDKQFQQNGQEIDQLKQKNQQLENKLAESTNDMNKLKEHVNKNTEDIKGVKEEQINIKAMLANHEKILADNKIQIANQEKMLAKMDEDRKKSEENQKAHDEIMAMLWNKLDEWNGIKEPTRETNDNRESTNISLSSFKYKNPFRNNSQIPKMERADMAHSHDENQ